jgi:hypothetical protein
LTCVPWHVRNTCYWNNMCFSHTFLIALIKKYIFLTCLKDTCQSYTWVLWNFLYWPLYIEKWQSSRDPTHLKDKNEWAITIFLLCLSVSPLSVSCAVSCWVPTDHSSHRERERGRDGERERCWKTPHKPYQHQMHPPSAMLLPIKGFYQSMYYYYHNQGFFLFLNNVNV